ncbi:MAG: mechanosensitive ion channel [Halioglobus sp.]|nr:mechanosensitive ion channel [Halioglobus sp.]
MDITADILQQPLFTVGETTLTLGQLLSVIAFALLGILFVVWSTRFLRRRLTAREVSPDIVHLLSRAYLVLGFVILAFMVLDFLNIPLAAFAFISGAVAIGIGFGAQNILNNFISGWILMWERPIKIGDFLELGDIRGTVESINTRSTRIRRVDGVHVLFPNSHLLENTVTNWTLMDNLVRTSVRVGVAYGSDVQRVTALLNEAATAHPDVLSDPPHAVIFDDFGDNALMFELYVWVLSNAERGARVIRSDLRYRIDTLFKDNAVVIAFPQRDVHVDGQISIRQDAPA